MMLSSLFSSAPSDDEKAQQAELKHARKDKREVKKKLLETLQECQAGTVELTEKLAEAVKVVEGLDESSDDIKKPKVEKDDVS